MVGVVKCVEEEDYNTSHGGDGGSLSLLRVPSFDFSSPLRSPGGGSRKLSVVSFPSTHTARSSLASLPALAPVDPSQFVNYPEDKRPSRRLPMRATSRRSDIHKISLLDMCCCCSSKRKDS